MQLCLKNISSCEENYSVLKLKLKENDFYTFSSVRSHLKCTVVSSGIQAQIINLLDILLHSINVKKVKNDNNQFLINLAALLNFSASCIFLYNGLNNQQWTVQLRNTIKFEGFIVDFKGSKWLLWSSCLILDKGKVPNFEETHPVTHNKAFT